ncbi:hypothetical protein [Mesorhizobium sp. M0276]|uniref:hypothetical protein n=1 Tax=Mesorhizobium sp. M0276 TaxID=2956928 RepID=UPI00333B78C7
MSRQVLPVKEKVAAHRARQVAAGRQLVNTYLPAELIVQIDQTKDAEGVRGRTPIIEAALRFYFEKKHEGIK